MLQKRVNKFSLVKSSSLFSMEDSIKWLSTEQDFLHRKFMLDARSLDKEGLLDAFSHVLRQNMMNQHLFKRLMVYCTESGVALPSFAELLS